MKKALIVFSLLSLAGWASPALANSSTKEAGKPAHMQEGFTSEEKAIIRDVFDHLVLGDDGRHGDDDYRGDHHGGKAGKGGSLPPGLAKRGGDLPPGLKKHIEKNGTLPPGLAKRDLPPELVRRLPRRHDGTEIVWVDDDLLLIDATTSIVRDILIDAARGK